MKGLQYLIIRFTEHGNKWPEDTLLLYSRGQQPQNAFLVYRHTTALTKDAPTLNCLPGILDLVSGNTYKSEYILSPQQHCLYLSQSAFMQLFTKDFYFKLAILQAMSTSKNYALSAYE